MFQPGTGPVKEVKMRTEPFPKAGHPPAFRIGEGRAVYSATWQARPYEFCITPENQNQLWVAVHQGGDTLPRGPWVFNYAVRRVPCTFVSGDVQRES